MFMKMNYGATIFINIIIIIIDWIIHYSPAQFLAHPLMQIDPESIVLPQTFLFLTQTA